MRTMSLLALVIWLSAVFVSAGGAGSKERKGRPIGVFVVESVIRDPEEKKVEDYKGLVFFLRGGASVVQTPKGKFVAEVRDDWDPTKRPATVDLLVMRGELVGLAKEKEKVLGIYEWTEDTLRLCLARPGAKERPGKLAAPKDSGLTLIILKKQP